MPAEDAADTGRVALVTGAASGIGRATALALAEGGWKTVALVDRDGDGLARVGAEIGALGAMAVPIMADLGDLDRTSAIVPELVARHGRLDTMVHCAAIARPSIMAVDYGTELFNQDLDINLTSAFILAREAARAMIAANVQGSMVFIASINAQGAGVGSVGYCVSKAGLVALMKVLAAELGPQGIRVNTVSPGPTDTPRSVSRVGAAVMQRLRQRFDGAALRRLGEASEIADAVVFLASGRSSYVSGHDLVVDGGLMASVYVAARNED
jgi:NAD(P)-dependent dehydrogenase (short-subunit alcohol dehydrogenase family)